MLCRKPCSLEIAWLFDIAPRLTTKLIKTDSPYETDRVKVKHGGIKDSKCLSFKDIQQATKIYFYASTDEIWYYYATETTELSSLLGQVDRYIVILEIAWEKNNKGSLGFGFCDKGTQRHGYIFFSLLEKFFRVLLVEVVPNISHYPTNLF